jgi:phage tail sheath protein FI
MRSLTTSPAKLALAATLDASCFTAENSGFRALDGVAFNIMYIPPYRDGGSVDLEVLAAAASYCGKHGAMLIIDPPREWSDTDAAVRGVGSIRNALGADAKNAMVYFPYLKRGGASTGELPPGGAVAGIIVRTDLQYGVWRSPAGLEAQVRGANGAAISVSDTDLDRLSPNAVNCLRPIPGAGPVVWGARTLDGAANGGEWKYIPVRRLALLIEESLVRGLAWMAFEHNGEALWALVRQAAGSFLDELHRRGAFQGASPRDAYFVKCDRETTTSADVVLGVANLLIGFAPLRPAEFIVLRVQLRTASPP